MDIGKREIALLQFFTQGAEEPGSAVLTSAVL